MIALGKGVCIDVVESFSRPRGCMGEREKRERGSVRKDRDMENPSFETSRSSPTHTTKGTMNTSCILRKVDAASGRPTATTAGREFPYWKHRRDQFLPFRQP